MDLCRTYMSYCFYRFYDFFCGYFLMYRPSHNNLFQIMQQDIIKNLIGVIFNQWKHLEQKH